MGEGEEVGEGREEEEVVGKGKGKQTDLEAGVEGLEINGGEK
jgi:hypothetical protein